MERGEGGKRNCFDPGAELHATEREEEGRAKMINGMRKEKKEAAPIFFCTNYLELV